MNSICYLCGKPNLAGQHLSDDHVIPATLIARSQPKVKGFDYGGVLKTHAVCNNRFGDETYVTKALELLSILHSSEMSAPMQHRLHEGITILPLDASKLAHFTSKDLRFFKLIDARDVDTRTLRDPAFYLDKPKTNPVREALKVALSVLAKSAAALLVKRNLRSTPPVWRIYAQPYVGDLSRLDLSELVGETKPFDTELRAWIVPLPNNNWQVVYAAKQTLVFFTFVFADRLRAFEAIRAAHSGAETFKFLGTNINELLISGWHKS